MRGPVQLVEPLIDDLKKAIDEYIHAPGQNWAQLIEVERLAE
jgi:hypothetical protein